VTVSAVSTFDKESHTDRTYSPRWRGSIAPGRCATEVREDAVKVGETYKPRCERRYTKPFGPGQSLNSRPPEWVSRETRTRDLGICNVLERYKWSSEVRLPSFALESPPIPRRILEDGSECVHAGGVLESSDTPGFRHLQAWPMFDIDAFVPECRDCWTRNVWDETYRNRRRNGPQPVVSCSMRDRNIFQSVKNVLAKTSLCVSFQTHHATFELRKTTP
jgi:hypothetical protein